MEFTVRRLQKEDRHWFEVLIKAYVSEYISTENQLPAHSDPKFGEVYWNFMLGNWKNVVSTVACSGDTMIGFCLANVHEYSELEKAYFNGEKIGEMWDIYTVPEWRGKGVGKELIALSEKIFKEKGISDVVLQSVDVNNIGAIKLYERLGYKPYTYKFHKQLP